MIWSDLEITQSFIVKNSKQCINFNTGSVTNMKNSLEKLSLKFHSICGAKDVAMKIC